MRLSGVLAIIDPTGGQSRRETVVSHTPRTGSRCACPALRAAAFGGVTRDLGALLVQLNSMPAAMSAAPASATLLAKGNRREWLMMNSRVLRSSRVGAILLRFAGQSNSFILFIRRFAIA